MQKLFLFVDKVSTFVGQTFSWLALALTITISWEVFSRYFLDTPHSWAFDAMIMMYGAMFMMAGAYTLSKAGHVRGDVRPVDDPIAAQLAAAWQHGEPDRAIRGILGRGGLIASNWQPTDVDVNVLAGIINMRESG
jgi:hypothetical protein